ncbi:MAG: hypothetical protein V1777_01665 [Candidatus Micrarchaeota archaeon]
MILSENWKILSEGDSQGHQTQIWTDNAGRLLVVVFEKKTAEESAGLALELYKAFVTKEDPEPLLVLLSGSGLAITKKSQDRFFGFLFVQSEPVFCINETDKINSELQTLETQLQQAEKLVLARAKALSLEIRPLHEASDQQKTAFFSSPLNWLALSGASIQTLAVQNTEQKPVDVQYPNTGQFWLGLDKNQTVIQEPFVLFKKTMASGGTPQDRYRLLQVFVESALLSSTGVLAFDPKNHLDGLQNQNPSRTELAKNKVSLEPIGFPVLEMTVPSNVKINLSKIDVMAALDLFRTGQTPAVSVIHDILSNNLAQNWSQTIERIGILQPKNQRTQFQLRKAVRLCLLIENRYPGVFNGPNQVNELAKSWGTGLGRASLLKLNEWDNRAKLILLHALIRELNDYYKTQGNSKPVKAVIALPEIENLLGRQADWKIQELILNDLKTASANGIGFFVSAAKPSDVNQSLFENISCEISIVGQNDAGVRIENRKPYRVLLRPTLSQSGA